MSDIKNRETDKAYKNITDRVYKLTEAVYKVTELFSDKEPLKWTLRNNSIDIYIKILSIKTNKRVFKETLDFTQQIINILGLASSGTFVSSLNFEILKKEYISIMIFLEGKKDDFNLEQKLLIDPIGQFENLVSQKTLNVRDKAKSQPVKKFISDIKKKPISKIKKIVENSISGSERKQKILDFLRENGQKTIKEISIIFGNISEKTVQRDLFELTKLGKIKAEGEKRWRVYTAI